MPEETDYHRCEEPSADGTPCGQIVSGPDETCRWHDRDELDAEIRSLAVEIEQTIEEGEQFIAALPEFEERSARAKALENAYPEVN